MCLGDFIPQAPIVNAAHSRALDVDAGAAGSPIPVALRVTASLDFPCLLQWVAADGSLVGAPVFQLADDWGTIRVTDPDIVPDAIYEFAAECDGMLSALGSDGTPIWGDLDATGAVDVDDILCVLDGFAGLFFSCSPESVDLDPCEAPNGLIDVSDILRLLDAFSGAAYPCPVPCS